MKRLIMLLWLTFSFLLSGASLAHHTKDHMILAEDAGQVIAATREGDGSGLIWFAVIIILLLGFVRWWNNRK